MAGCVLAVSLSLPRCPRAHFRNREAQHLVGFVKNGFGCRIFIRQLLAHARVLRSLPRKDECNFAHRYSLSRTVTEDRGGGELLFNFSFMRARASPAATRMAFFHGVGVRTPMTDHTNAADAQQRRAAVLRIINRLPKRLESSLRKHSPHLRKERTIDRFPQQPKNLKRQAFANLQRDVADKAVADDDITLPEKRSPPSTFPTKCTGLFFSRV